MMNLLLHRKRNNMSQKSYRVVIAVPPGYKHSQAFIEVAMLVKSSLSDLGIDCDIALNEVAPGRVNVLLGYHLLSLNDDLRNVEYIPYQLEQLSVTEGFYSDRAEEILRHASAVWDYSLENIAFLSGRGIRAVHLPLGYHRKLERIPHSKEKDIDIFFFGSGGERRCAILDTLSASTTIVTKALFGAYGEARDHYIGRAKMILNIHAYDAKIFEAVRISYLINNRVFVVSEDSLHYPYPHVPLCMVPYEDLVETCETCVANPDKMQKDAQECYQAFKTHYKMTDLLTRVM